MSKTEENINRFNEYLLNLANQYTGMNETKSNLGLEKLKMAALRTPSKSFTRPTASNDKVAEYMKRFEKQLEEGLPNAIRQERQYGLQEGRRTSQESRKIKEPRKVYENLEGGRTRMETY